MSIKVTRTNEELTEVIRNIEYFTKHDKIDPNVSEWIVGRIETVKKSISMAEFEAKGDVEYDPWFDGTTKR